MKLQIIKPGEKYAATGKYYFAQNKCQCQMFYQQIQSCKIVYFESMDCYRVFENVRINEQIIMDTGNVKDQEQILQKIPLNCAGILLIEGEIISYVDFLKKLEDLLVLFKNLSYQSFNNAAIMLQTDNMAYAQELTIINEKLKVQSNCNPTIISFSDANQQHPQEICQIYHYDENFEIIFDHIFKQSELCSFLEQVGKDYQLPVNYICVLPQINSQASKSIVQKILQKIAPEFLLRISNIQQTDKYYIQHKGNQLQISEQSYKITQNSRTSQRDGYLQVNISTIPVVYQLSEPVINFNHLCLGQTIINAIHNSQLALSCFINSLPGYCCGFVVNDQIVNWGRIIKIRQIKDQIFLLIDTKLKSEFSKLILCEGAAYQCE